MKSNRLRVLRLEWIVRPVTTWFVLDTIVPFLFSCEILRGERTPYLTLQETAAADGGSISSQMISEQTLTSSDLMQPWTYIQCFLHHKRPVTRFVAHTAPVRLCGYTQLSILMLPDISSMCFRLKERTQSTLSHALVKWDREGSETLEGSCVGLHHCVCESLIALPSSRCCREVVSTSIW